MAATKPEVGSETPRHKTTAPDRAVTTPQYGTLQHITACCNANRRNPVGPQKTLSEQHRRACCGRIAGLNRSTGL